MYLLGNGLCVCLSLILALIESVNIFHHYNSQSEISISWKLAGIELDVFNFGFEAPIYAN